jgi:hypothetical protein
MMINNGVELLEERLRALRAEMLAQTREAGEIDEEHGRVLLDRLLQEVGHRRELLRHRRCMKPPQRLALHEDAALAPLLEPESKGGEEEPRRKGRGDRHRQGQPVAAGERQGGYDGPKNQRRSCKRQRKRHAADGEGKNREKRQHPAGGEIDATRRAIANEPLARREVRNRGCHDLDARQDRIERRGEGVGGPDRCRSDDDDTPANPVSVAAVEHALSAERRNGVAGAVEPDRKVEAEVEARRRRPDTDGVALELRIRVCRRRCCL